MTRRALTVAHPGMKERRLAVLEADYYDDETQGDWAFGVAPARSTRTADWFTPDDIAITLMESRYGAS